MNLICVGVKEGGERINLTEKRDSMRERERERERERRGEREREEREKERESQNVKRNTLRERGGGGMI